MTYDIILSFMTVFLAPSACGVSQLIRCSSFLCEPSGFATFNIATNGCSACTGGSSVEDFNYKVLWSLSRIR